MPSPIRTLCYSVSFEDGARVQLDTDDVIFVAGSTVGVKWHPENVFPLEEPDMYAVNITLHFLDVSTGTQTKTVLLATEIPNNGSALVTMPMDYGIGTFAIQVTAVTSVPRTQNNFLPLLSEPVGVWSQYAYIVVSDMLKSKCNTWWYSQQEMVGDELLAKVSPCPPTVRHASVDTNFTRDDSSISRTLHPEAKECFQQIIPYVFKSL